MAGKRLGVFLKIFVYDQLLKRKKGEVDLVLYRPIRFIFNSFTNFGKKLLEIVRFINDSGIGEIGQSDIVSAAKIFAQ